LCNCHGQRGGKKCGGCPKTRGARKGRKRDRHDLQKIQRDTSSKQFLQSMEEDINNGKLNMLEYVIVSAIIISLEASTGNSNVSLVLKYYNIILAFLCKHEIVSLAIAEKTLMDMCKIVKQILTIRKTMK